MKKYLHPNRTSKNVAGDFYSVGGWCDNGSEYGECLDCLLPESQAPTLLANIEKESTYTHFIRQPETLDEIEKACLACEVCCAYALRYGGTNIDIINRLGNSPEYCDYVCDKNYQLFQALDKHGHYLPFAVVWLEKYYLRRMGVLRYSWLRVIKPKIDSFKKYLKKVV